MALDFIEEAGDKPFFFISPTFRYMTRFRGAKIWLKSTVPSVPSCHPFRGRSLSLKAIRMIKIHYREGS